MYQYKGIEDTIVAISTAAGQGGIGIVRLSGRDSLGVADKILKTKSGTKISSLKSHAVHYGWAVDQQIIIDEVLITLMKSPRSYTREDVVEISCHGGTASLRTILVLATKNGARLAEPGEFTKRAFLNGRIDLTQAEAVLDIIQSKTETFLRISTNQLKGELSVELETIRNILMNVYTEIEAVVNFPEDDVDSQGYKKIQADIKSALDRVEKILASSSHGRILKDGIKIVLCGKPNVGKSSLLNALLKTERAIVSHIAGTTRDVIEETAQIKGIPFQLVDTAGILEPRDMIEEEAIKRSHMSMQSADLVMLVLDASQALTEEDYQLMKKIKNQHVIVVANKSDLFSKIKTQDFLELKDVPIVKVSALTKSGIADLEEAIVERVLEAKTVDTHGVILSNLRHINALQSCQENLSAALQESHDGLSLEFISEEIKSAVNYLDGITGRNIDTDLLNTIFSQFCIGK